MKTLIRISLITFLAANVISCTTAPVSPAPIEKAVPVEKAEPCAKGTFCLVWEDAVKAKITPAMLAANVSSFCPKYKGLDGKTVWLNIVKSLAWAESEWNPETTYRETTMGTDPVTGAQIVSEGLMQLSYTDSRNWSSIAACKAIDYAKKNIRDPIVNISCAMGIMGKLVARDPAKDISDTKSGGAYWSSARLPYKDAKGKWHHTASREKMKKLMPECQ
jgi:hypothetical protein